MNNNAFSNLFLLGFLRDPASVEAIHAVANQRGIQGYRLEEGTIAEATLYLKTNPSSRLLIIELPREGDASTLLDALADVVNPHTKVIVIGHTDTLTFYQWLMGLGIQEYLLAPVTPAAFLAAIDKGSAAGSVAEKPTHAKKLIGFIGARGGVGTTTMATSLAALLAEEYHVPTGLVDLDSHFGSVALSLDLEPGRGMRDALEKPGRIDGLFLDRVMIKPLPNLSILSAEEPLHELAAPHANAGEVLMKTLAEKFDVVVADIPRQMNGLTRYVLANADIVVIVAEPQLIDLRDALHIRDYVVEQLKRPAPLLLINREGMADGKSELPVAEITKHYGAAPLGRIPLIPEAFALNAEGKLLTQQPKIAKSLAPLHDIIARSGDYTTAEKPTKKEGLRGRFSMKAKT